MRHLFTDDTIVLKTMGFSWLLYMPHIWVNHGLLIDFVERWHGEHNTFHFRTSEATITLEDVHCILRVPFHGDLICMIEEL